MPRCLDTLVATLQLYTASSVKSTQAELADQMGVAGSSSSKTDK